MKLAKVILAIVFVFALFIPSNLVHADVAPPSQPSGSNVVPGEVTMVQMVYERVVIDLRSPWSDGINADVTARFVMRNQGTVDEQMAVGFPLNSIENITYDPGLTPKLTDFIAKVDGIVVASQFTSENQWLVNEDQEVGLFKDWAVFNVTFPVGKDVIIELNYKQPPTYDAPTTQYDYTLITGAGWYGSIGAGDIIFRLPYTISYWENYWTYEDNLWGGINSEMIVENEARWHFENFEPQDYFKDNWSVGVIRPKDWQRILAARDAVTNNRYDAKLWMELGDAYSDSALKLGGKMCNHSADAITAYQQSVVLRPDWAEAHARLAAEYHCAYHDSSFISDEPDENLKEAYLQELSVALALDSTNQTALDLLKRLKELDPDLKLPLPTPYATLTSEPLTELETSNTPIVVTVVHTKIVNPPTSILEPEPTAVSASTQVAASDENQKATGAPLIIFGALIVFTAGIGAGRFWSKRMENKPAHWTQKR